MSQCFRCGASLKNDEIAIYKKLVNRGATDCMCIDCLAAYFGVSRQAIEDKIRYFRESGTCVLFQ